MTWVLQGTEGHTLGHLIEGKVIFARDPHCLSQESSLSNPCCRTLETRQAAHLPCLLGKAQALHCVLPSDQDMERSRHHLHKDRHWQDPQQAGSCHMRRLAAAQQVHRLNWKTSPRVLQMWVNQTWGRLLQSH